MSKEAMEIRTELLNTIVSSVRNADTTLSTEVQIGYLKGLEMAVRILDGIVTRINGL